MLDVGVSSIGAGADVGVSVVWDADKLQDDTPMTTAMLIIHKRFLISSSSFQFNMVILALRYRNSPSVFCSRLP
jgi:hypothetical protein